MQRHVFLRIVDTLSNHDEYFQMRVDALCWKGLSSLQKCTIALCILAYGSPTNYVDEYVQIGETTLMECFKLFVSGICTIFRNECLRRPNNKDIERLLQMGVSSSAHPCIRLTYLQRRIEVHDKQKYCQLQAYLIEHI